MTFFKQHIIERVLILVLVLFSSGCATFYQINLDFNQKFEYGELEAANKVLDNNIRESEKKARFLYFTNKGVVESMLGNFAISNEWFEKAYQQRPAYFAFFLTNQWHKKLKSDPRYPVFLEKLGLLEYWKAMPKADDEAQP